MTLGQCVRAKVKVKEGIDARFSLQLLPRILNMTSNMYKHHSILVSIDCQRLSHHIAAKETDFRTLHHQPL